MGGLIECCLYRRVARSLYQDHVRLASKQMQQPAARDIRSFSCADNCVTNDEHDTLRRKDDVDFYECRAAAASHEQQYTISL